MELGGLGYLKASQLGTVSPPPSLTALGIHVGEVESGRVTMFHDLS
jgi:hypothetical protein